MILAEQGHAVEKWTNGRDPILSLHRGAELWDWINHAKSVRTRPATDLFTLPEWPEVVIDNFRPATLMRLGIDPAALAASHGLVWVSLRSEIGEVSFDLLAQARSWMEYAPWLPFYAGDTCAGLWLAFKALSARSLGRPGHYPIGHASCLQKLVEGELVIDQPRDGATIPWDRDAYAFADGRAVVEYRGTRYEELPRDRQWKLAHLWHEGGRIRI